MTIVLTNRTTDYNGSPADENQVYTATGPITLTFSKRSQKLSFIEIFSRSDNAPFESTEKFEWPGRYTVYLAPGDQFYFVAMVGRGLESFDLAFTNAS